MENGYRYRSAHPTAIEDANNTPAFTRIVHLAEVALFTFAIRLKGADHVIRANTL